MTDALDGDFGGTFPFEARFLGRGKTSLHYVDEGPTGAPRSCSSTATPPGATSGAARSPS